jgi:hypothetical protein
MRSKLLSIVWLAGAAFGCDRKAGSTAGGSDTTSTPGADSTATAEATGKAEILAVTVRVRTADGKVGDLQVNVDQADSTRGHDAIFFSVAAVKDFLLPYYAREKGVSRDSLANILKEVERQGEKKGIILVLHKLKCYIVIPRDLFSGPFPRSIDADSRSVGLVHQRLKIGVAAKRPERRIFPDERPGCG